MSALCQPSSVRGRDEATHTPRIGQALTKAYFVGAAGHGQQIAFGDRGLEFHYPVKAKPTLTLAPPR
jgi:hypothetical protein